MFCSNCGSVLIDGAAFCEKCGTPVQTASHMQVQPVAFRPVLGSQQTNPTEPIPQFPPVPENLQSDNKQGTPQHFAATQSQVLGSEQIPSLTTEPEPARTEKPKKTKLFIIIGIVVAVLLIIGVVVGVLVWQENERANAYTAAQVAYDSGKYQEALDACIELGDYRDAKQLSDYAQAQLDLQAADALFVSGDYKQAKNAYQKLLVTVDEKQLQESEIVDRCNRILEDIKNYELAESLYAKKDYTAAIAALKLIINQKTLKVDDFLNKCDYGIAGDLLADGDNYGAYLAYIALGDFNDAAAKADSCKIAFPETGLLYQNPDYISKASSIRFDNSNNKVALYYKIYTGDLLVAEVFVNAGGVYELELPPSIYRIKEGTGELWWGPDKAFGSEGYYDILTFDGAETYNLADNIIMTLSVNLDGDGNVESNKTNYNDF